MPVPLEIKQKLVAGGMDDLLAFHFARILIRDPLMLCTEDLDELDLNTSYLFEMFQGLTWQALRFKPPPPQNIHNVGWRVEFRCMEVQPTDFENAAFAIFIILLTRAVLAFDVDFYMPISMVDENMETAHLRDAANRREFFFPATWVTKNAHEDRARESAHNSSDRPYLSCPCMAHDSSTSLNGYSSASANAGPPPPSHSAVYPLSRLSTIINGPSSPTLNFSSPGLLPLIKRYLSTLPPTILTPAQRAELDPYLDLVARRADGLDPTPATKIRDFVKSDSGYQGNSHIGREVEWGIINEFGIEKRRTSVGEPGCGTNGRLQTYEGDN